MKLLNGDIELATELLQRKGISNPTKSELALEFIRNRRSGLLDNCDWEITKALETGSDATALKQYRQALRDLPANSTPSLDKNNKLTGVTWPTKPE